MKVLILFSVFLLCSCGRLPDIPIFKIPYAPPHDFNNEEGQQTSSQPNPWGVVRCGNIKEQVIFSEKVRIFLSSYGTSLAEGKEFSCTSSTGSLSIPNDGGFFISGKVKFEGGQFSPNNSRQSLIVKGTKSSYIVYQIYDVYNIKVLPKNNSGMYLSHGTVSNGIFNLTFSDNAGKITMTNGYVEYNSQSNKYIFKATLGFSNNSYIDSKSQTVQTANVSGRLGTFAIDACALFDCVQ